MGQGRPPTPYLPWLLLRETNLDVGSPITSGVDTLAFGSAGVIEPLAGATSTLTPLARTSPGSAPLMTAQLVGRIDPRRLIRDF